MSRPVELEPYFDRQGARYEQPSRTGYVAMPVLQFLDGKKLSPELFGWIESLRPPLVRIVRFGHAVTCDAWHWRVTIYLREDNTTIDRIEQEVIVGLHGDVEHGADLRGRTGV
jgi:hypothetical protein